ncbi:MAG: GntR family transcriptional regulator [Anaerolineae bacterium]|nr:GntR family transcriptional regulator [Anaerolineae bacterium]
MSDQVYEHLRRAIICSELVPGEKLVEMDIAAQMGTSQGPVREALHHLEHDGLVERRARSATYVTSIPLDEMYELFSIRSTIEVFAIRRTAQKVTPAQCEVLEDLVQKMAEAGRQQEIITLAEYDMQFHRHIVEWSGNVGLLHVWTPLSSQIQRFIVQSHPQQYPDFVEVGIRHQPIVAALRAHDGKGAAQTMQDHIMLIWSQINP